jgi:hypothetical protein
MACEEKPLPYIFRRLLLEPQLLQAARRRQIDAVLVWRLDRWGRSVADLMVTLQELNELGPVTQ